MNDHDEFDPAGDDPVLSPAGDRLRRSIPPLSGSAVEAAVLRQRVRRMAVVAGVAVVAVAVLGTALLLRSPSDRKKQLVGKRPGTPTTGEVESLLKSLGDEPIDPRKVRLVSSVSTFDNCDGLIGDLRKVGAEHVGSQGFGALYGRFTPVGTRMQEDSSAPATAGRATTAASAPAATTLGTNVQVSGVDELDFVKAEGKLIYDLDGKGNLRITEAESMKVLSKTAVTPLGKPAQVSQLLVAAGKVAVFGSETEESKPVKGDPSATKGSTEYMTVTFVDATDPAKPRTSDRIRIEGSLVSARLVEGEVRLVTTSNMADLGFVTPTTPNSVAKALEQNRRTVASSAAADWIPDWQRDGGERQPLVPCERVHVPTTFAGVAMTSMVTFPLGADRFEPAGTSILAPASTLYSGVDKVAISSEVWVDPIDRDRLKFDDWQTAIHEFSFEDKSVPTYAGSGIVDGSTIGQFAFGEVGRSLAVVTTKGTPWNQDEKAAIDLTILTPDGGGRLGTTSKITDLSNGKGAVTAVRFIDGRILVSTGFFGRQVVVIDVTDPAKPRRAGEVALGTTVGYFHPLPDRRALTVGSRADVVGSGDNERSRSWVQAQLLDVSNADAPTIVNTWEKPWTSDMVGSDHHAFTYWPERSLAMWGLQNTQGDFGGQNGAAVLRTDGQIAEVAAPVASKPNEVPAPCPVVTISDPDVRRAIGRAGVILRCDDAKLGEIEWPRYQCYKVDGGTTSRYGITGGGSVFACSLAPFPTVSRVLVVSGRPILYTEQTLETLDPDTFRSTSITYHPSGGPEAIR